jgi:hypothetical protein
MSSERPTASREFFGRRSDVHYVATTFSDALESVELFFFITS